MRWSVLLIALGALLVTGCQKTMLRDDLAKVQPQTAAQIAADWSQMLEQRYPVATVFQIRGKGEIGLALTQALRDKGFGIADEQQSPAPAAIALDVRTDNLGKTGVLVSLVVADEIFSRSYHLGQGSTVPSSRFTRLASEDAR